MARIIAGRYGGHRIATPPGATTRPTTDRVREAVFAALVSWLGTGGVPADEQLAGIGFLDLYAGSGAVGLEAASRGAEPVRIVESDARVSRVALGNARTLGSTAQVTAAKVEKYVAQPAPAAFDVVWLDPPYGLGSEAVSDVIEAVVANGWLAEAGIVLVERSARDREPTWPDDLPEAWSRRYGETMVYFVTRGSDAMTAVVPGSFDPVTRGHIDIVGRAAAMFGTVVVAVGANNTKNYLFTPDERLELVREAVVGIDGASAEPMSGLLVDFCAGYPDPVIVKGIRGSADVDFEIGMARMNSAMTGVDTVMLPASAEWGHVSSTLVRQIAQLGGDVTAFVPEVVAERLGTKGKR